METFRGNIAFISINTLIFLYLVFINPFFVTCKTSGEQLNLWVNLFKN